MPKQKNAAALIKKMSRETLESILLDRLGEDAALERRILAEYGSSTTVDHYKSLVDGMLDGLQGWGYRGYSEDDAYSAALEIEGLFDKAEKKPVEDRARAVFTIAQAVIERLVPSLDERDDHDGNLYSTVDETFGRVAEIAKSKRAESDLLADISRWAENLVSSDRLGSWRREWAERCIAIAVSAARSAERLREIIALCDSFVDAGKPNFSSIYLAEEIALIKIELLGRLKAKAERKAFIEAHLDFHGVRELAIKEAFEAKDFARCKTLASDGISHAAKNDLPGHIDGYRTSLVEAMDAEGAGNEADRLVERWAIEAHGDSWFKALKKRAPKGEWKATMERVLAAIESRGDRTRLLASLYASERLLDRLMDLCEKKPREFVEYYRKLMKTYPSRVAPLLKDYIGHKAATDTKRNSYGETASLVGDYGSCAGAAAASAFIDELESRYASRRAMREELEKVRPRQ